MTGISYISSFMLILSVSLISANRLSDLASISDGLVDGSSNTGDTTTSEPSIIAETSTPSAETTTENSDTTTGDLDGTTVDTTSPSESSTTAGDTTTSEPSITAETSTPSAETTTENSDTTAGDTTTSEPSITAETSTPSGETTTENSDTTTGDPDGTTVDTTSPSESSTTAGDTTTSEPSITAETSTPSGETTTENSDTTTGDPDGTTVDTTSPSESSTTAGDTTTSEPSTTAETSTPSAETTTENSDTTTAVTTDVVTTTEDIVTSTVAVTTTTRSTQSTTRTTTAKPITCENGGTPQPNNLACLCPKGFTGRYCGTVETQFVPAELDRTVNVTMDVNQPFTPEYEDPKSETYKKFVEKFNKTVIPLYQKIANFSHVGTIILSAGGPLTRSQRRSVNLQKNKKRVKVKHDVIFKLKNNKDMQTAYEDGIKAIKTALEELKNNKDFPVSDVNASSTDINDEEVCVKATEELPEELQKYYTLVNVSDTLECVTSCNVAHPQPKTCMNRGTCEVTKKGPSCFCLHDDVNWYLGADCSLQVNKIGFYAGLGSVAAIAVITVAVLTAYLVMNKRTVKRNKDIKQQLVKEWLEDDFEWPPPKKTSYPVDRYDNPVYLPGDNSLTYKPNFSANRSSTQNFSPEPEINLWHLQRDQTMKMDRPQIRTSFDI